MQSYRIVISHADIDGVPVDFDYADVFIVVREGATEPGPDDWEAQVRTDQYHRLTMARHDLALTAPDGSCMRGAAIVRFSDGHRHLFRGDDELDGFEPHDPRVGPPPTSGDAPDGDGDGDGARTEGGD